MVYHIWVILGAISDAYFLHGACGLLLNWDVISLNTDWERKWDLNGFEDEQMNFTYHDISAMVWTESGLVESSQNDPTFQLGEFLKQKISIDYSLIFS